MIYKSHFIVILILYFAFCSYQVSDKYIVILSKRQIAFLPILPMSDWHTPSMDADHLSPDQEDELVPVDADDVMRRSR